MVDRFSPFCIASSSARSAWRGDAIQHCAQVVGAAIATTSLTSSRSRPDQSAAIWPNRVRLRGREHLDSSSRSRRRDYRRGRRNSSSYDRRRTFAEQASTHWIVGADLGGVGTGSRSPQRCRCMRAAMRPLPGSSVSWPIVFPPAAFVVANRRRRIPVWTPVSYPISRCKPLGVRSRCSGGWEETGSPPVAANRANIEGRDPTHERCDTFRFPPRIVPPR